MNRKGAYLISLQPTQIHHVVTQFRDLRHQIYSFLQEPKGELHRRLRAPSQTEVRRGLNRETMCFYLDLFAVHACLGAVLQEVLRESVTTVLTLNTHCENSSAQYQTHHVTLNVTRMAVDDE